MAIDPRVVIGVAAVATATMVVVVADRRSRTAEPVLWKLPELWTR